jgi:hypothetical protein
VNALRENQFTQFRLQLYQKHFNKRDDTLMDLVDALSSNTHAQSVVELSLNPCFRRDYNSLFKSLHEYQYYWVHQNLAQLAAPYLPQPQNRNFWLLGVDVTSCSRPYATKLADKSYVYQPNPIRTNKPVTLGHQYSSVCLLPERISQSPHWVVPLSNRRVVKQDDKEKVGAEQIRLLLEDQTLPFYQQLCVEVADSSYSKPEYLLSLITQTNLVSIVRVRSNHVFYRQPANTAKVRRGHPAWYGARFALRDPSTWSAPDLKLTTTFTSPKNQCYQVNIEVWDNLLMRKGGRRVQELCLHNYPVRLARISFNRDNGESVYTRPLWLIIMGSRRQEIKLEEISLAYHQRYDMEHFFRFGKQRMLLTRYQTPEVEHEQNWWQLVHLAYLQLWVAQRYAANQPRPWERYLPQMRQKCPSPAMVQRNFGAISRRFGTPAYLPKRRGYSPGRPKGKGPPVKPNKSPIFSH